MTTFARTETGLVRQTNEDRFLVREERAATLLAVADGVGGAWGGEIASARALEILGERFFTAPPKLAIPDALADAVRSANDAVVTAGHRSGHVGAASTLVAAAARDDRLAVANLGDSRAYLVRDGGARQITADHSGKVPNSLTRFVGDPAGAQPDMFVETLLAGDRVVLCSDGLTRYVSAEEIARSLGGADLERAANALVDLALARGGEDNVTVVLYEPAPRSHLFTRRSRALPIAILVTLVVLVVTGAVAALLRSAAALPATP